MKKLLLPFLFFFASEGFAQKVKRIETVSNHSVYIKGNIFEGTIFSESYIPPRYNYADTIKRFTPSAADITQVEKLVLKDVILKGRGKINDPFICANLKKYLRQYAGFTISGGKKIVYVNLFWKAAILHEEKEHKTFPQIPGPEWKKEWMFYFDGGNRYWRIKINLSSMELFDFEENGTA